ncbi:hypothetical protein J6590_086839 [Homalodisca vitripennis]|nr:hypothetical protein J6590_086839 [Homalodisca vitripennis]
MEIKKTDSQADNLTKKFLYHPTQAKGNLRHHSNGSAARDKADNCGSAARDKADNYVYS